MKNILILTLISWAFTLVNASANQITCSSHNQNLEYLESSYTGGPAPHPGQELSRRKIVVGNLLSQEIVYFQDKEPKGEWKVQLNFTELHTLGTTGNPNFGTRDYVSKLEILDSEGTFLADFFVICKKVWMYAP